MYATPADGYMIPQLVIPRMVLSPEQLLSLCPRIGRARCVAQARMLSTRYRLYSRIDFRIRDFLN